MDLIEISGNEPLARAVERANEICIEPIRSHWDGTLFNADTSDADDEGDALRFKLGFDHVSELLSPEVEDGQSIQLVSCQGNLETLSMTFVFKLSDSLVNGRIRISSVLNQSTESIFKMHLKKVRVKSIVGLRISGDTYEVDHVIHEFTDASLSLVYKRESKMIPVYSTIKEKHIKHSLVQYLVNYYTRKPIAEIEKKLRSAFGLMLVSVSLGDLSSFRNLFRGHTERMKGAFDRLVDEIIDSTNALVLKKVPKIALPSVSVILNFRKQEKNSFQAWRNSLTDLNFLLKKKRTVVTLENGLVYLYVPVDFADLSIQYANIKAKQGEREIRCSEIQEHYRTEGSYLTIVLKRLDEDKVDLNLLEFKIAKLWFIDSSDQTCIDDSIRPWINSILEFKVVPVIEQTFENYLRLAMENEKFSRMALRG